MKEEPNPFESFNILNLTDVRKLNEGRGGEQTTENIENGGITALRMMVKLLTNRRTESYGANFKIFARVNFELRFVSFVS